MSLLVARWSIFALYSGVLNLEVLDLMTRAVLLPPTTPSLEIEDTSTAVTTKAEPVRLIPDSVDEEAEFSSAGMEGGAAGDLTAAEREALRISEGDEIARRNLPVRAYTHPLPHPNEVFFLKVRFSALIYTC